MNFSLQSTGFLNPHSRNRGLTYLRLIHPHSLKKLNFLFNIYLISYPHETEEYRNKLINDYKNIHNKTEKEIIYYNKLLIQHELLKNNPNKNVIYPLINNNKFNVKFIQHILNDTKFMKLLGIHYYSFNSIVYLHYVDE